MLVSIRIQNFALIEDVEVDFAPGFNVLTGETGAGKTILLGAMDLLLGARASTDDIRAGEERAIIEGLFAISEGDAHEALTALDLEEDDPSVLLVRRVLSHGGKSRITVNGNIVTNSMLRRVTRHLVDVSTQHNQYALLHEPAHLNVLDRYAGLEETTQKFGRNYEDYRGLLAEKEKLQHAESERIEREDFLRFQLEEITSSDLHPDEEDTLNAERNRLRNAGSLQTESAAAASALANSPNAALTALMLSLDHLQKIDMMDEQLPPILARVDSVRIEVEDLAYELERYTRDIVFDPQRLESVEERHATIRKLMRKYGGTFQSVLHKQTEIATELDSLGHAEERLETLDTEINILHLALLKQAKSLSTKRTKSAKHLMRQMEEQLNTLSLEGCRFHIEVAHNNEALSATGYDRVSFQIAPNVGEGLQPLARGASGGELSRILLALKSALVAADPVSTSVFDEVDTGVGGAVAERIGQKLKTTATARQIICISHLPQVASYAHRHILVKKETHKERTRTTVSTLTEKERKDEIARMLGGVDLTKQALDHANKMLAASLSWNPCT